MKKLSKTLGLLLALAPGLATADIYLNNRNACQAISGVWMNTPMLRNRVAECRLHESITIPRDQFLEIAPGYDLYIDSGTTLTNKGRILIYRTGQLLVEDGFLSNQAWLRNDGNLAVQSGSVLNSGDIENDSSISILRRPNSSLSNLLFNTGTINLEDDGRITNESVVLNYPGGQITTLAGSAISNDGHYYSRDDRIAGRFVNNFRGEVQVSQTMTLESGAEFDNQGSLAVSGSPGALVLRNGSRFDNTLHGEIRIRGGSMTLFGSTLDNHGDLFNEPGSAVYVTQAGRLTNSVGALIDNRALITINCQSTFKNHGAVSGTPVKQLFCLPLSLN